MAVTQHGKLNECLGLLEELSRLCKRDKKIRTLGVCLEERTNRTQVDVNDDYNSIDFNERTDCIRWARARSNCGASIIDPLGNWECRILSRASPAA